MRRRRERVFFGDHASKKRGLAIFWGKILKDIDVFDGRDPTGVWLWDFTRQLDGRTPTGVPRAEEIVLSQF